LKPKKEDIGLKKQKDLLSLKRYTVGKKKGVPIEDRTQGAKEEGQQNQEGERSEESTTKNSSERFEFENRG